MSSSAERTALRAYRTSDFDFLSIYEDEEGIWEIVVRRWKWRRAYVARVRNFGKPDEEILLDEEIKE